ncbi:BnaC04g19600D [Brassica napus]|uniref:Uncharacterized protein n=2 Tax=Brassica TaxID=3705 RepID=A0A3P6CKN7_BRAOL|nr:unnamed protein product [Brassica napus]CDY08651.1 BnaC04g19600D [Brassica napus]VDD08942.1 unnamed protein product [Brassica oleracea]
MRRENMSPSLSATNPLPIVSAVGFESDVSQAQREASCNYFQRMIVSDLDLDVLAKARLDKLEGLKLDKCSGFSTDGLLSIVKPCREEEWKSCTNAEEVGQVLDSMWMVEIE